MSLEKLKETFVDYLAKCAVPRVTIHDVLERRMTAPVTDAEAWWSTGLQSLLLIGGVGTGKTVAACSLLRHNWREIAVFMHEPSDMPPEHRWRSGIYVDMGDLSTRGLFDDDAKMLRHRAQESELAILDDTGRERGDGAQALESIFMARHANQRRTIITANLSPDALVERIGSRVLDRIQGNGKIVNCGKISLRASRDA